MFEGLIGTERGGEDAYLGTNLDDWGHESRYTTAFGTFVPGIRHNTERLDSEIGASGYEGIGRIGRLLEARLFAKCSLWYKK